MRKELKEFWELLTNPMMIGLLIFVVTITYINTIQMNEYERTQIEQKENLNK